MTKLCETRAKIPCFRPAPTPLPTPYRIYIGTQIIAYKRENVQIISYDNFISKTLYGINHMNFLFFSFLFFFFFFFLFLVLNYVLSLMAIKGAPNIMARSCVDWQNYVKTDLLDA